MIEPIRLKFFISTDYSNLIKPASENIFEIDSTEQGSVNKVQYLWGEKSKEIVQKLTHSQFDSELDKYKEILDFLYLYDGQTEFYDLLNVIVNGKKGDVFSRVIHISDLAAA